MLERRSATFRRSDEFSALKICKLPAGSIIFLIARRLQLGHKGTHTTISPTKLTPLVPARLSLKMCHLEG